MPIFEEIHEVMNQTPVMGSTGDPSLDLYISSGEQVYLKTQEEIRQRLPLFKRRPSDLVGQLDLEGVFKECMQLINSGKAQADSFMAAADAQVHQTRNRAQHAFATASSKLKPEGTTDEGLSLRCHSLELMFDSLTAAKIPVKIEEELRSGDALTKFILRENQAWFGYYLDARKIDRTLWYQAIKNTCELWETDLQRACDALIAISAQEERVAEAKKSLTKVWGELTTTLLAALPSNRRMTANSLDDLPDDHLITAADLRKYATCGALRIAKGQW